MINDKHYLEYPISSLSYMDYLIYKYLSDGYSCSIGSYIRMVTFSPQEMIQYPAMDRYLIAWGLTAQIGTYMTSRLNQLLDQC